MADEALTSITVAGLVKTAEGKSRILYEIDSKTLLFVATDKISAYDAIMKNGVILTLLSAHWFRILPGLVPDLKTHFLTLSLPSVVPETYKAILEHRSMQVRRLKIFPIEAIVRGYITGSAWKEYQRSGTVHGMPMVQGLRESEAFPQGAIYTPSTKAVIGKHDENITKEQAAEILGSKYAEKIEDLALKIYTAARDYAAERGIIIADTKFEFGLDEATNEIVLVDEVITPDSSRFWPASDYIVGKGQKSYDKQFLRDWLTREGLQGKDGVVIPNSIVVETANKYKEAYERLTGQIFKLDL